MAPSINDFPVGDSTSSSCRVGINGFGRIGIHLPSVLD